jgi:hypothetical protein
MSVKPAPPVTLIESDFTGAWAIPASGLGIGDYMQVLGYREFLLNAKCDRDAQVFLQFSEDHNTWYTLRDRENSAVLVEHVNGTVGAGAGGTTITPSGQLAEAVIHNTHAANTLYASWDGGSLWKAILPGRRLSVPANVYTYKVKGSGAGTTYEILNEYYLYGYMVKANTKFTEKFYAGGSRYIRVLAQNLDAVNDLAANVDIKAMEAS